jgi:hypothetical protein
MRCGVHEVGCGICQGRRAARRVEARGTPKRMPEVWERFDRVSCVAMVSWSEAVQLCLTAGLSMQARPKGKVAARGGGR